MIKLNVEYKDKDAVKALGAKWNAEEKYWYISDDVDYQPFLEWISEETLKQIQSVVNVPFSEIFKHISNNISVPLLRYSVEGDVINEYELPKEGKMIFLIDNQQVQNQLPVFLPGKDIPPLKDTRISLTGRLELYQNGKFQLHAESIHRYGAPCSRLKYLEQWEKECADWLVGADSAKTAIPLEFRTNIKIGVITAKNAEGYKDFINTLNEKLVLQSEGQIMPLEIELSPENIREAIAQLQSQGCDCICLIRGGGDKETLLSFSHPTLLKAIFESSTPIIIGVGHTSDQLLCKRVRGCYNADTPTGAAQFLNRLAGQFNQRQRLNAKKNESESFRQLLDQAIADINQLETDKSNLKRELYQAYQTIEELRRYNDTLKTEMAEINQGAQSKKGFWQRLFK